MEKEKEKDQEKNNVKNYVLIKLPVKVENMSKASNLLGTPKEIYDKIISGQDLSFDFFYNKLPLENFFSNDILLKRKTYRNKKDNSKKKYKYLIMGKITNMMQATALENFIYINEEKTNLDDLGKYLIKKEDYEKEEIIPNEEGKVVSNLIKKKYKEINSESEGENIEKYLKYFQPKNFANTKNSSQIVPKLIANKFSIEQFKEG